MRARGSAATETMMLVSVVVIGTAGAAYSFMPGFESGVGEASNDVSVLLDDGWAGTYTRSGDGTTAGDSRFGLNRNSGANSGRGGTEGDGRLPPDLEDAGSYASYAVGRTPGSNMERGTNGCCAYAASASLSGTSASQIYDEMFAGNYSFRDGTCSLTSLSDYFITEHCRNAPVTMGASPAALQDAYKPGSQSVTLILDMKRDANGNRVPATDCSGNCGHAMTFAGMTNDGRYAFKDDTGALVFLTEAELMAAWGPHDRGMLVVPHERTPGATIPGCTA